MDYYRDLFAPTKLSKGDSLFSATKLFRLTLQKDGNLALMRIGYKNLPQNGPDGREYESDWDASMWGTFTYAAMQLDGNFVAYDNEIITVFSTGTHGYYGAFLRCQDDGNLVVYYGNTVIWDLNTYRRQHFLPAAPESVRMERA